jgi:hypothetical protein
VLPLFKLGVMDHLYKIPSIGLLEGSSYTFQYNDRHYTPIGLTLKEFYRWDLIDIIHFT